MLLRSQTTPQNMKKVNNGDLTGMKKSKSCLLSCKHYGQEHKMEKAELIFENFWNNMQS